MGSILVSPAFTPELIIDESRNFRNAASTSQLESDLASVKAAAEEAREELTEQSDAYQNAVNARESYAANGVKIPNFSDNILTDYNQLYLNTYQKWYDAGEVEGDNRIKDLITEIVLTRKYKKNDWGEAVIPGTLYKKKNLYDRIYNNNSQFKRYRFQQDEVVRAFIQRLVDEKRTYDTRVKSLNDEVVRLKPLLDAAQKKFNDQQALVTKTAKDLETARNLPEMTKIAADAKTASDKIAAEAALETARIQSQAETIRQRNRTLILGGVAVALVGIGAFLFLRK
jgi:hypothetical protein